MTQTGTEILAISVDQIYSHNVFAASLGTLPYPLLSDWHQTAVNEYGVFNEKDEVAIRSCFLVDKKGEIVLQNKEFNANQPDDYEQILRACASLSSS